MRRKRDHYQFGLSFLDCICCGFGAIILLFILTLGSQSTVTRTTVDTLQQILQQRLATLALFRTEQDQIEVQLAQKRTTIDEIIEQVKLMEGLIANLEQQIQNRRAGLEALLVENEDLRDEIAALQRRIDLPQPDTNMPVGLPMESNYIVFVADTSGSMRDPRTEQIWGPVFVKLDEILQAYPQVRGFQMMDADGRPILGRRQENWLEDTLENRRALFTGLMRYQIFSNSNPVPGIMRAIQNLYDPDDPDMRMCIFVLGDEFTGTADPVLRRLDQLNPVGPDGTRSIIINAVGFPAVINIPFGMGHTGLKYSNLMREVTHQHGGAFIAVSW